MHAQMQLIDNMFYWKAGRNVSLSLHCPLKKCVDTYLADQYPQVSPLPRPEWSECLWKRWGGGQCSHVPAIVSASYLKALGIAHLLHELGTGQNLFGEQRPISCTIKLVPLWHWHGGWKILWFRSNFKWRRMTSLQFAQIDVPKCRQNIVHTHGFSGSLKLPRSWQDNPESSEHTWAGGLW